MREVCALCLIKGPLLNSHIIPEFFYSHIYDAVHRFLVIPMDSSKRERFNQKGIREKLLCSRCEQKFAQWEKYAKEAFGDGHGIRIERHEKFFKLYNLNYRTFRLFLLSLLWRMGVSELDFFSSTDIGDKHLEKLRLALLNEDPLEPLQYPCLMIVVNIKGKLYPDWISQPTHNKSNEYHCHCIVINGILYVFYVSNHEPPEPLKEISINRKGEMIVYISDIWNIPFLAELASDMGRAIRERETNRI